MNVEPYIFPIALVDAEGQLRAHRGTAFPVTADGGMITCRHVVETSAEDLQPVIIDIDQPDHPAVPLEEVVAHPKLDLAFLPNPLRRDKKEHFGFAPDLSLMGARVFSLGHLETHKGGYEIHNFSGDVVLTNSYSDPEAELVLPYALVEGMSGSPVLLDRPGRAEPCVVGVGHGSHARRVLAHEVLDYEDEKRTLRETIHRVVEFGLAWHGSVVRCFLDELAVQYRVDA